MKAAIYVRMETEDGDRISSDMQIERCQLAAHASGATQVEVFTDAGYSGRDLHRPALQELLQRITEFDTIYVWRFDRLTRRLAEFAEMVEDMLRPHNIACISVRDSLNATTADPDTILQIMSQITEWDAGQ